MNYGAPSRDLFLPTLKSNVADHPIFYNNTKFISNTRAFYKDLDNKLDYNEQVLKNIISNCENKINKYNHSLTFNLKDRQGQEYIENRQEYYN